MGSEMDVGAPLAMIMRIQGARLLVPATRMERLSTLPRSGKRRLMC